MTVNYVAAAAIFILYDWLFGDILSDDRSLFSLHNILFCVVMWTLSYVWHNSDLARSLGVDCHILGEIMDTRRDEANEELQKMHDKYMCVLNGCDD